MLCLSRQAALICRALLLVPLFSVVSLHALAGASGDRPVVIEHMTADWCPYCPGATNALPRIQQMYDRTEVLCVSYHVFTDPLSTTWQISRRQYYSIGSVPNCVINGVVKTTVSSMLSEGEAGIQNTVNSLVGMIRSEQQRNANRQPFVCKLKGSIKATGAQITLNVLTPTGYSGNVNVIFLVTEDDIPVSAPNGVTRYYALFRAYLGTQSLSLPVAGSEAEKTINYTSAILCNSEANLHPVVLLQDTSTKEIMGAVGVFQEPVTAAGVGWEIYQ